MPRPLTQVLTELASTLPLTSSQHQELHCHDLPTLAHAPAQALWMTTLGGTATLLYSTGSGRRILQYHAAHGGQAYALTEDGARTLTLARALDLHATLPAHLKLTTRRMDPHHPRSPLLAELTAHSVTGDRVLTLLPTHPQYQQALALSGVQLRDPLDPRQATAYQAQLRILLTQAAA